MAVLEGSQLLEFLEGHSQRAWIDALDELGDALHPVDRDATRIWFAFWPLELKEALESPEGADEMARVMDLEGKWRLVEQIDGSVEFLYGAHYWAPVKKAVLRYRGDTESLADTIRTIAGSVAETEKVDVGLVLGITAVALMTLRQVGQEELEKTVDYPARGELLPRNPEQVVAQRKRESRDGMFTFLKGLNRRWEVRWNERAKDGTFRAINGQDIAMAGDAVEGDYRSLDYRRIAGPVPVECRVGSCGYCWVGLLGGRDKLSPITDFERERLAYFGYDTVNDDDDEHPLIRLSCQSQCLGDVTLAISPWNGELNRRHQTGRKKLGTS
jgi:ferredoxin